MSSLKAPKEAWTVVPKGTACVVIDMQRAFVDDEALLKCAGAREMVPKMNELTSLCRSLKIPVIFVKGNRRADGADSGLMDDMLPPFEDNQLDPCEGKKGNEFCEGLNIVKTDFIVPNVRYSTFIPGASQLETLLRGMEINSIILTGVATDVCVGMTAMEAMMLGFRVFLVTDLTATYTHERQQVALKVYNMHSAKLMTLDEVKNHLNK